jgi:HlyD family secretion protein
VLLASEVPFEPMKTGVAGRDSLEAQKTSLEEQMALIGGRVQASLESTEAMRQLYNSQIEAARQSIENITKKRGDTSIIAPIDGVVERLPVEDANLVSQVSPVAELASGLAVEVYIPLREIDGVKVGDTVELISARREADENTPGTVSEIDDEAGVKISALGVEERKVRVRIMPEADVFKPGYAMDVRFTVQELKGAVVVPKTAVFEADGQDTVWVVENGSAQYRAVSKGIETREGFEISAGLSAGELVIPDANTAGLAPGKPVK